MTKWPAAARTQTTTNSWRQTTMPTLQHSAVPPPVAQGRTRPRSRPRRTPQDAHILLLGSVQYLYASYIYILFFCPPPSPLFFLMHFLLAYFSFLLLMVLSGSYYLASGGHFPLWVLYFSLYLCYFLSLPLYVEDTSLTTSLRYQDAVLAASYIYS